MRLLLAACALLALLALFLVPRAFVASGRRESRMVDAARPAAVAGASEERVAALERRVEELELASGALRAELERLGLRREPLAAEAPPVAPPSAPDGAAREERGPSWYLEQYVASFANGGRGSEYFRLAVEAFAPGLLREIGGIVLDPRANAALRLRLVEMLGDARFRG
jgi:hypothetical protein